MNPETTFLGGYKIGYGDALHAARGDRRAAVTVSVSATVTAVIAAFLIGRASMNSAVSASYDSGFDAGVREATVEWGEWR